MGQLEIPELWATIVDGISLVQTFLQLAEFSLVQCLHEGFRNRRINIVFDVYGEMSIKDAAWFYRRCGHGMTGIQFKNIALHKVPAVMDAPMQSFQQNSPDQVPGGAVKWPTTERETSGKPQVTCKQLCSRIITEQWEELSWSELIISRRSWHVPICLCSPRSRICCCHCCGQICPVSWFCALGSASKSLDTWTRSVEQKPGQGFLTSPNSAIQSGEVSAMLWFDIVSVFARQWEDNSIEANKVWLG